MTVAMGPWVTMLRRGRSIWGAPAPSAAVGWCWGRGPEPGGGVSGDEGAALMAAMAGRAADRSPHAAVAVATRRGSSLSPSSRRGVRLTPHPAPRGRGWSAGWCRHTPPPPVSGGGRHLLRAGGVPVPPPPPGHGGDWWSSCGPPNLRKAHGGWSET